MKKQIINCPHCGKIISKDLWEKQNTSSNKIVKCPGCGSTKNWKNGKRHVPSGVIQLYFCRERKIWIAFLSIPTLRF